MINDPSFSQKHIFDILSYDPETGHFTHIKKRPGVKIGSRAGHVGQRGYRKMNVLGRTVLEHRLAWFYMTGQWPNEYIDHINRDKADNRWINLREATGTQNQGNLPSWNKFGAKGVQLARCGKRYQAVIKDGSKRRSLGTYATIDEAQAAYMVAAKAYFGEFASA